jgi:hypothetical protein
MHHGAGKSLPERPPVSELSQTEHRRQQPVRQLLGDGGARLVLEWLPSACHEAYSTEVKLGAAVAIISGCHVGSSPFFRAFSIR